MRPSSLCRTLARVSAVAVSAWYLAACGAPTQSTVPFSNSVAGKGARVDASGCGKSVV